MGSGAVVAGIGGRALRWMEGYWHRWLNPLRRRMVAMRVARFEVAEQRWLELADGILDCSPDARREYSRLDVDLHHHPNDPALVQPTTLGNILRAAERSPRDRYGLDAVTSWPQLWLVMPETAREQMNAARSQLDAVATTIVWGLLFVVWVYWAWWTAVLGVGVAIGSIPWLHQRARLFGDLLRAAYDVHRTELYRALRWPFPSSPSEERKLGVAMAAYLRRGSDAATPTFTDPDRARQRDRRIN